MKYMLFHFDKYLQSISNMPVICSQIQRLGMAIGAGLGKLLMDRTGKHLNEVGQGKF